MLSLSLRAQNDACDEALSGYDSFVRVFDLEPPDGFSSMASFNTELENYLDRFQGDRREHLNQTCAAAHAPHLSRSARGMNWRSD